MKKNDPRIRRRYHQYLLRAEEAQNKKQEETAVRKEIKKAIESLDQDLHLSDSSDVEMQVPGVTKIITRKRAHVQAMKKKVRKWKKESVPADAEMDEA
jgi:vancomycin resistance protein YoaR